jgi:hypothetical protein
MLFAYCGYAAAFREIPEVCVLQTKTFPFFPGFVITCSISMEIALHSVHLPLLITLFLINQIARNAIDLKCIC